MSREVKGIVIRPGNAWERKVFRDLKDYQLEVDGLIEPIHLYDYTYTNEVATMYVNEEGRILDLRLNVIAGGISHLLNNENMLYGNAIVVGRADEDGYHTDVPEWLVEFVSRVAEEVPQS